MLRISTDPPEVIFNIDLAPFKPFLVKLPPGSMVGMRREQVGYPSVFQEITASQSMFGERAGITAADYAKFVTLNGQHGMIFVEIPLMEKAYEVLQESLAHVDNLRHRLAATFADSAESHARAEGGDPTLLTVYEKTIKYRGVIAAKSVKTRKKNQLAKKAQADAKAASEATVTTGAAELTVPTVPIGTTTSGGTLKPASPILRIPNPPPEDIFGINLAPLKTFLVNLPPGATVGMRRAQDGWQSVFLEITSSQAAYGERAGITAADYARFVALNEQYGQIFAQLLLVEKALSVLTESLAHVDNLRHRLAVAFADAAESHARAEGGDPTLLTAYAKTIAYRAVIADKAVKARKKSGESQTISP
jgi:hypothetical protein